MTSASGKRPTRPEKRKVLHFHGEPAQNGFLIHHRLEPRKIPRAGGGSMPAMDDVDPKPYMATDKQSALDHISGLMDQMGPSDQSPDQAVAG